MFGWIRWVAVFGLVASLFAMPACRPDGAQAQTPPGEDNGRGNDAAALPAFEGDAAVAAAGELERFHVQLGDAPTRGPDTAPVTVVMFSDFECPFCQQGFHTLLKLEKEYRGRVRIAYKAFPLDNHSLALPAAMAARTAQAQGKFWEYHDLLFSQGGLDIQRLVDYAEKVGVSVKQLMRDLEALEYGPEVRRDMRQARRLGVTSTPTFFVNGRHLSGAQPIEIFRAVVDEELEAATKWTKSGVPADKLYAHAIKDGYREVRYSESARRLDPDGVFPVPVGDSPTLGPSTAPVTIVVFGDFECPFCARGFETVEAMRKQYKGKIRVAYKHHPLPFHSHAFIAARAAAAAHAQGKFWSFHDALYQRRAKFDEEDLVKIARKVGLNMKAFYKAMNDATLDRAIEADQELAMGLGVTGTPAYFVNGRPIEGAQPEIQFRLLIEEELDRANKALKSGIKPDKLYDHLMRQPLE